MAAQNAPLQTLVPPASSLAERFQSGRRFAGRLKPFLEYLIDCYLAGEALVVVSRQTARLKELWEEQRLVEWSPGSGVY